MIFRELYERAAALPGPPVGFNYLCDLIVAYHADIGRIETYAVTHPEPDRQAYWRLGDTDRSSGYDEEFQVGQIVYCDGLDSDERERRFALTKELMHVFDQAEARVDTPDKFRSLLREIQNKPLEQSSMMKSELDTRWMAAIILCPKPFRDSVIDDYKAKKLENFDIAEKFNIPEWVAPFVMDDYYEVAFARLMGL